MIKKLKAWWRNIFNRPAKDKRNKRYCIVAFDSSTRNYQMHYYNFIEDAMDCKKRLRKEAFYNESIKVYILDQNNKTFVLWD